jgi:N-acetylmuramoyl-L-alanine amidase
LNSTRRFVVRTGSAVALLVLLVAGIARADSANYIFANQTLTFSHLVRTAGGTAVGVNDPGFRGLLKSLGATLTWHPGERYVLIETPQPAVLNFAVGQKRFDMGLLSGTAAFAPFIQGNEVFLPFDDLLHGLSLAQKDDSGTSILQPQLTSVDVQGSGAQALVVAHAAVPLHPRIVTDAPDRVVYEFDGVASSIDGSRDVNAGGIRSMQITTSGTVRDPHTTLVLGLSPNARHDAPHSNSGDFEVAFGANGGAPPLIGSNAAAQPLQAPVQNQSAPGSQQPQTQPVTPAPIENSAGGASVTGIQVLQQAGGGETVTVAVSGNASYEWHHLRDPDNRFWIDIKGAQLQGGPRDEAEADPLSGMRARQIDPQTVRIALSLTGPKQLSVSPSATGVLITIGNAVASDDVRTGTGNIGSVVSANEPQTLVTPVPPQDYGQQTAGSTENTPWKFGGRSSYVPTNPRLIVIDPGHGGSDRGAIRNGLAEADVNLDMAKRLRAVLVARGWQVVMTRATDVDVYAPNDSARDELQARIDVANHAGARIFISIHSNSYINSGPNGTTTYYSKPMDVPLAQSIDHELVPLLGTKDDGTIKARYYVTLHANMPAVLIETAFLSNPDDFAKLSSPDWRQKVAEGIADGIDHYNTEYPVSGNAQ